MRFLPALLWLASILPIYAQAAPQTSIAIYAAGDIGQCNSIGAALTAGLLKQNTGPVLVLGDIAYRDGSPEEFIRCYAPHWGDLRDRIYPAPGNHEYRTQDAAGYFGYFGARAGDPARGYYSFDVGPWHILSLNSNRELEDDAPQLQWLETDLRQHKQRCVLAFWHHARYSSGPHGSDARTQALWSMLYRHGVSVVVAGHDHDYERFAPMNAQGERDDLHGMRSFVVGTGGAILYELDARHPLSEAWNDTEWGVLKLMLRQDSYAWEFLPVASGTFRDAGSAQCNQR